ncbi:MAG TPA: ATP-binding protein [Gemmataceae bacterium]|nr:ATP-binding protein [Gemmataceae bacterium]
MPRGLGRAGGRGRRDKEVGGVARPWRIRHKLMSGFGLVVGIMALLLGGTLIGLLSYNDTMKTMDSKLEELRVAGAFRDTMRQLVHPESVSPATSQEERQYLDAKIDKAREDLDAYRRQLKFTVDKHRDPDGGQRESDQIEGIEELFRRLQKAIADYAAKPHSNMQKGTFLHDDPAVVTNLRALMQATDDLQDIIYKDLRQRIVASKGYYRTSLVIVLSTSILGVLLMAGLLRFFYGWVFYPVRDLEAGACRVAQGDFEHRIEVHSGDEMEELAEAFNNMTGRLCEIYRDLNRQVNERSRQLVRSERLASVGFLAAGVAHEINNPLASIAFCSEALEARLQDLLRHLRASGRLDEEQEIFGKYLKMIQEEAFRCKNITERLLAFSRPGERRREKTDLRELVQLVLDVTQHLPNHRGKEIKFEMSAERLVGGGTISAWVNSEEIKSVVLNLVVNALDSMDEGGRLTIRLGQRDDMAELQFTDTGCGMTQEVLENIFEPFYTRSRTGKGTGLGLTISHRIITQHGGEIEATSAGANQGSTFIVRLPINVPETLPLVPGPGATPPGKDLTPLAA